MIDLTTTNILLFLILIMVLWVYMRQYSTSLGRSTQAVETRNIDMEAHLALLQVLEKIEYNTREK